MRGSDGDFSHSAGALSLRKIDIHDLLACLEDGVVVMIGKEIFDAAWFHKIGSPLEFGRGRRLTCADEQLF